MLFRARTTCSTMLVILGTVNCGVVLGRASEQMAQDDLPDREVSQLINGYRRIREELAGGPLPKIRTASSPARRTQEASGSGGGVGSQQGGRQPRVTQGIGECTAAGTKQSSVPHTVPALFDCMGPNSSDPIFPHPADAPDLHEHQELMVVEASGLDVFRNIEKPTPRRSLPPLRRSPGPRSRDADHSPQMDQMMEMLKAVTLQLQDVKTQVDKLQQDRDPFPLRPVVHNDDDDEDDDRGADR